MAELSDDVLGLYREAGLVSVGVITIRLSDLPHPRPAG
jgi:hypothetical protein